jgi:hypothetical protein
MLSFDFYSYVLLTRIAENDNLTSIAVVFFKNAIARH